MKRWMSQIGSEGFLFSILLQSRMSSYRQRLDSSPTKYNELFSLQLSWAWEPILESCEKKIHQLCFSSRHDWMVTN
jgi:hypothetical protein